MLLLAAARERGATGYGVDLNEELVKEAMQNIKSHRLTDRVVVECKVWYGMVTACFGSFMKDVLHLSNAEGLQTLQP